jgi:hypothetical protein
LFFGPDLASSFSDSHRRRTTDERLDQGTSLILYQRNSCLGKISQHLFLYRHGTGMPGFLGHLGRGMKDTIICRPTPWHGRTRFTGTSSSETNRRWSHRATSLPNNSRTWGPTWESSAHFAVWIEELESCDKNMLRGGAADWQLELVHTTSSTGRPGQPESNASSMNLKTNSSRDPYGVIFLRFDGKQYRHDDDDPMEAVSHVVPLGRKSH